MGFRILSACALALALAGCGKPAGTRVNAAGGGGLGADKAVELQPLPGGITGTHWHIPWRTIDPKHPRAKPVTVLIADADTGTMSNENNNILLRLRDVRAKLYSEGRPAADLLARQVETDRRSRIVVATGDVRLVSLTNPPDTVLTADRLTWDTRTKILVATGNAHFVSRQPGKPIREAVGGTIKYNIATEEGDQF